MDLNYSKDELAFRDEVRGWLSANLPQDLRDKIANYDELGREDLMRWHKILAKKGWVAPAWPKEWGGTGWNVVQRYIFEEECGYAGTPPLIPFGLSMCGPVLLRFGTDAQKQRFLPRIYNGDDFWCQGYSEPGSGSDLASLKTKAVREGDHYVVNGQKIWTSRAQHADWMFCLVRTDGGAKLQRGISYLLIDMKTPGLTLRPILTIDGEHHFNEVFFDNVRVPAHNLVGEENKGWNYAKYLLGHERVGIARIGASKYRVQRAKELAARVYVDDKPLAETERFREKVAALEVELKALEITQMRVIANSRNLPPGVQDPASSVLKLKGTELAQAATEILMEIAGPDAMAWQSEHLWGTATDEPIGPEWAATLAPDYFYTRAASIYGGSNEIQKNVIAKRILGL